MQAQPKMLALPFDFLDPEENPVDLAYFLAEYLLSHNGITVAAPTAGFPYRVLAVRSNPIIVAFNPKIIEVSEDEETMEEAVIDRPGYIVKVKRPDAIKVRFTEANGNVRTEFYMGLTARYFQQAIDTLDGIPITKRASPVHKEQAKNLLRKLVKKNGIIKV